MYLLNDRLLLLLYLSGRCVLVYVEERVEIVRRVKQLRH
jgi:hypothetical protein